MIIATILEAIFLFPTDVPRDNGSPVGCHFPRQITVFEPHIMATTPEWVPLVRTALVDRATQVLAVHGGVVMLRVHSGIPLLCLVWIPLLCVVVWVRVSLGECPTPPALRAPHVPSAMHCLVFVVHHGLVHIVQCG